MSAVDCPSFSLRLSSDVAGKNQLRARLKEFGEIRHWPAETRNELELVIEEWMTNLCSYAFAGIAKPTIEVQVSATENEAFVRISDNGIPFNPENHPAPDFSIPPEDRPIGGLGIHMMKQLVDALSYERKAGRNILQLKKLLQPKSENQ